MYIWNLIPLVYFTGIFGVNSYTLNDSITLMNDMLRDYDKRHRPIENQSAPIKVSVLAVRPIIYNNVFRKKYEQL